MNVRINKMKAALEARAKAPPPLDFLIWDRVAREGCSAEIAARMCLKTPERVAEIVAQVDEWISGLWSECSPTPEEVHVTFTTLTKIRLGAERDGHVPVSADPKQEVCNCLAALTGCPA